MPEFKGVPIATVKALDEEQGIAEMIVSVFGNKDYGGDRVVYGAFANSLGRKFPKGVWMHDWTKPIAKTLEAKELPPGDTLLPDKIKANGGLYVKGHFNLKTQRGKEAFSDLVFGTVDEFSFAYDVIHSKKGADGARELTELDIHEWSPVFLGMNPATALLTVKQRYDRAHRKEGGRSLSDEGLKGEYLGDVGGQITWSSLWALEDRLFYDVIYEELFWREDEPLESRLANIEGALNEFVQYALKIVQTLLTLGLDDDNEETTEESMPDMKVSGMDSGNSSLKALRRIAGAYRTSRLTAQGAKSPAGLPLGVQVSIALAAVDTCLERCDEVRALRGRDGRDLGKERLMELEALKERLIAFCDAAKPAPPVLDWKAQAEILSLRLKQSRLEV